MVENYAEVKHPNTPCANKNPACDVMEIILGAGLKVNIITRQKSIILKRNRGFDMIRHVFIIYFYFNVE